MVLVDDREGGVVEVHEGLVHPPGRMGDNQTHQEQEARLRDEESQPLQTLRLEIISRIRIRNDGKMILKTLRRTARKIVARTRRAMKVNSKSSGLKLIMRPAPMGV